MGINVKGGKFAYWSYALFLHMSTAVLAFRTTFAATILGSIGVDHPADTARIASTHEIHKSMDAIVPEGSAVFLGDSIMAYFVTTSVEPNSISFGVSGQRCSHLLESLGNYRSLPRARRIYVMIGTNDVFRHQDGRLEGCYAALLDALPNNVPVTLVSVLPIDRKGIDGRDEAARNSAMRVCKARNRCEFVDGYTAFKNQGRPIADLLRDGIHPNGQGYRVLRDAIADSRQDSLDYGSIKSSL